MCDAELFFKCENLQKVGAFKIRGATNTILLLAPQDLAKGVVTHSSGNHAQAVALAASWRKAKAYVVMPEDSPGVKRRAVAYYGAEIILCAPTLDARETTQAEVIARTGAVAIHPYNDDRVVAGQGTAALELCADVPDLDGIVAPVGGGGLMSGTAIAAVGVAPGMAVYGVEPKLADDAYRSLQTGKIQPPCPPVTVADGLRTALCELTFSIIQRHVKEIVTVSEEEIVAATRHIWERMKLVVEPSGAVPLAALLFHRQLFRGRRFGLILSGGNVDMDHLPWSGRPGATVG
jgi:threonine dehydratase